MIIYLINGKTHSCGLFCFLILFLKCIIMTKHDHMKIWESRHFLTIKKKKKYIFVHYLDYIKYKV